jgi:DNA replication protein DnaC
MMKNEPLLLRAKALKLYGLIARWEEVCQTDWIEQLILWEETERSQRGLERRLAHAHLGRFKLLANFDWKWPKKCIRQPIEELMGLAFVKESSNIILCGPNGVGKSMIARNIAYQAILFGHTSLFVTAGEMLNELAAQDGDNALRRRMKFYSQPTVLVIDEMGYLSYSNRHCDLLFQLISKRYQKRPTIITTNKPFSEWGEMFPNVGSVVALIDRLVHHSEIINIEAESYRLKEAEEENLQRKTSRSKKVKISREEK